jgi:hypothetical protein
MWVLEVTITDKIYNVRGCENIIIYVSQGSDYYL